MLSVFSFSNEWRVCSSSESFLWCYFERRKLFNLERLFGRGVAWEVLSLSFSICRWLVDFEQSGNFWVKVNTIIVIYLQYLEDIQFQPIQMSLSHFWSLMYCTVCIGGLSIRQSADRFPSWDRISGISQPLTSAIQWDKAQEKI